MTPVMSSTWSTHLSEAFAPFRNGFPISAARTKASPGHKYSAALLGISLAVASIYGVPQAINPNLVKLSLACFEILTVAALIRACRFNARSDFLFVVLVLAAIASKTIYGVVVANGLWGVPPVDALIEARFGLALCALPLAVRFFQRTSKKEIEYLLIGFTVAVLVLDFVFILSFPHLLSFGQRGAERFVISMMGASGVAYFYLLKGASLNVRPHLTVMLLSAIWLLHVFIVTTSRADAAVLFGLLLTTIVSMVRVRQNTVMAILAFAVPALLAVAIFVALRSDTLGGRDVAYFIHELTDSFPTGVGFLPDSTRNSSVVHFTPIFASDYGVGLYVYRYGVLSIGILAALGFVVVQGVKGALQTSGAPIFMLAVLAYILIIPFWEYGALNGAFLTAALLLSSTVGVNHVTP